MAWAACAASAASAMASAGAWEAETLVRWREPMLRFARLHLPSPEEAEDAVHDTLLAVLASHPAAGDPRRYLFGVLRHKIIDRLRARYRAPVALPDDEALDALLFTAGGHWAPGMAPAPWRGPEDDARTREFFDLLDACVHRLPPHQAQVFSMRMFLECEAPEICRVLGLSRSAYWQCLSRARKQLQACLSEYGLSGEGRA